MTRTNEEAKREASARLERGHGASPRPREQRKLEDKARAFKFSAEMENLIQMKMKDPGRFARVITPRLRIALGHYAATCEAAEELGIDASKGETMGKAAIAELEKQVIHRQGCPKERFAGGVPVDVYESYTLDGPGGKHTVCRCLVCAGHLVIRPDGTVVHE